LLKISPNFEGMEGFDNAIRHKFCAYKVQLQVVDFAIISSRQTMEDIQSVLCSHTAAGKVGKLVTLRFEEWRVMDLMSSGE
jgi:hypothetical protein